MWLIRRYVDDFLNRGDEQAAGEALSPDLVFHGPSDAEPIRGLANYKEFVAHLRQAYPDLSVTSELEMAAGNKAAFRFTMRGTHSGAEWRGVRPHGEPIEVTGLDVFRIKDGRIEEMWVYMDTAQAVAGPEGEPA
jgi:steroid delta-isomerase-like uncharacterized protein